MVLVLVVGYVSTGAVIAIFFSEAEVNDIHEVGSLVCAHHEVSWFDVAMNKAICMDEFDAKKLNMDRMTVSKKKGER